ncbi:hypothetical protein AD936_18410, partial [Gluconobacter japonicus]
HIRMALRFVSSMQDDEDIEIPEDAVEPDDIDPAHHPEVQIEEPPADEEKKEAEVVSLAAFRKRPPT